MKARIPARLRTPVQSAAIALTILGQPYSKANRRKVARLRYRDDTGEIQTRPRLIKSKEALDYELAALSQIPPECRQRLSGPVCVRIRIFYSSNRSDLDESVILDVLQDRYARRKTKAGKRRELLQEGIYRNDRQVWDKHVTKGIDRENPRAEIVVEPMTAQQIALALGQSDAGA